MSWIDENGPLGDMVLSSRIRLARNIAALPFPSTMDEKVAQQVLNKLKDSILAGNSVLSSEFQALRMMELPTLDRFILVEKHMSSTELAQKSKFGMILMDRHEKVSIMVNEEDHIRMQCIYPGLQLDNAWELLNRIDDFIEESVEYSFDEQIGYLTSCPTNVGTGLRASLMVHLPALKISKQMDALSQTLAKIGMTVRGFYGEGSDAEGDIFQISNQISLGSSEDEIILNIDTVGRQIIEKEKMAREVFLEADRAKFEDRVWRALGIFKYARKLAAKEFMELLSYVRLGVSVGIIKELDSVGLNALMVAGQTAHLKAYAGKEMSEPDLDIVRAEVVRNRINIH